MIELVISVSSLRAVVFKNSLNAAKGPGKTSTMVNVRAVWLVLISGCFVLLCIDNA